MRCRPALSGPAAQPPVRPRLLVFACWLVLCAQAPAPCLSANYAQVTPGSGTRLQYYYPTVGIIEQVACPELFTRSAQDQRDQSVYTTWYRTCVSPVGQPHTFLAPTLYPNRSITEMWPLSYVTKYIARQAGIPTIEYTAQAGDTYIMEELDPDCHYILHTSFFTPADCKLPRKCGPPKWIAINGSWTGDEYGWCMGSRTQRTGNAWQSMRLTRLTYVDFLGYFRPKEVIPSVVTYDASELLNAFVLLTNSSHSALYTIMELEHYPTLEGETLVPPRFSYDEKGAPCYTRLGIELEARVRPRNDAIYDLPLGVYGWFTDKSIDMMDYTEVNHEYLIGRLCVGGFENELGAFLHECGVIDTTCTAEPFKVAYGIWGGQHILDWIETILTLVVRAAIASLDIVAEIIIALSADYPILPCLLASIGVGAYYDSLLRGAAVALVSYMLFRT